MSDYPQTPFQPGDAIGVAEHLNAEFALVGDSVQAVADDLALSNEVLHGPGRESGGCGLSVGTGLSCVIGAGYYWAAGQRCENQAPVVVALPASQTSYLYQDADGMVVPYSSRQTPNPEGTWFCGTATTDGMGCIAVDDTEADVVAGNAALSAQVSGLDSRMEAAEELLEEHEDRITDLESGGGGGGGTGPVYADPLRRSYSNAETVGQKFAALEAEIDALQDAVGSGGNVVAVEQPAWDIDAVNGALHLQAQTTEDALEAAYSQVNTIQIKHGVFGDGSGETPNYIDAASTWI